MSPSSKCSACKDGVTPPFPFSMAFQPIVNVDTEEIFAYEALVRGPQGEPAGFVLTQVNEINRYSFDQVCRVKAITLAAKLGLIETGARLSINFFPGAVYSPVACIKLTLETARSCKFPTDRLIFEFTESEQIIDPPHLRNIIAEYRRQGFQLALDDFGAGYSGLNLLAELPPDILKLDMALTRNLHQRPAARAIVQAMVDLGRSLGCQLIAEGVETMHEYTSLRDCGISLMQGYLFARPGFEALPACTFPVAEFSAAPMRPAAAAPQPFAILSAH